MTVIELKRISMSSVDPTFGVMLHDGQPFAVTLERPWISNKRMVSCIPDGDYLCERVRSPKFGDTFEVTQVTGRSHILFHKGNIEDDTHGCIIVGEQFDYLNGVRGVLSSKHGFEEFLSILQNEDEFRLMITDHYS